MPVEPAAWPAGLQLAGQSPRAWLLPVWLRYLRASGRRPDTWEEKSLSMLDCLLAGFSDRRPFRYAIYVGTPSVYAKDTIQCQDSRGRVIGYTKIPRGPAAPESIARELATLEMLASRISDETFFPTVLARSGGLVLQSAPPAREAGKPVAHAASILALLEKSFGTSLAWSASPVRSTLHRHLEVVASASHPWARPLACAIEYLEEAAGRRQLPHVLTHGDFVPWNLRGRFAFDWEWAQEGLAGHDALHFVWFRAISGRFPVTPGGLLRHWSRSSGELGKRANPALDPFLCISYLTSRLAFYAASALDNGDEPARFRFLRHFHHLLNTWPRSHPRGA